ncbi:MAG: hypothetical protein HZA14_06435 [Nitrospirae bacterium]|nr:hypothetical protein [Nitrospirota bacterium]
MRIKLSLGILLTLLIPILVALSVVIYAVYSLSTISGRTTLIEISDDINIALLEVRRYEKNLILFNEEENVEKFYGYLNQIKKMIGDIENELISETGKLNYDLLIKELETYKEASQPLISSVKAEQTLVEDIRPLGRIIEKDALYKETALELRRYEKNYIIYKEQFAVDRLHAAAKEIMEKQPAISGFVGNYLDAFDTLVESERQKEISVEKMWQSGRAIENITMEFSNKQRIAIDNTISTSKKQLIGAFAFLMLSTFILIYLFSDHVVKALKAIEHSFSRLKAGDYTFGIDLRKSTAAEEIICFADAYNQTINDLRESREELERTLKKLADANKELIERQDELVEARKVTAMRLLSSEIAHEINNPLSSITTFLGMFHEDMPDTDSRKETLALMLKETERCRLVLQELVDFARKEPLRLRETDPKKLLNEAIEIVQRQKLKDIIFKSNLEGLPEKVVLDPILIHQAIINILANAYQFTSSGGSITVEGYNDGNNCMIIEVRDTGMGISQEDLPRIFEPFFSTRKDLGGSGLGLALTKKIIERHNGDIHVESRRGEETVFKISLPVA